MRFVKAKDVHQGRRRSRRRHVGHREREQKREVQRLLRVRAKREAVGTAGRPIGRGQDVRRRASACWHRGERVAMGGGEKWPTTAVAQHHAVQRPRRGEQRSNGNVAASDSYRAGIATGGSCVGAPGALLALISSLAPGAMVYLVNVVFLATVYDVQIVVVAPKTAVPEFYDVDGAPLGTAAGVAQLVARSTAAWGAGSAMRGESTHRADGGEHGAVHQRRDARDECLLRVCARVRASRGPNR